MFHLSVRKSEMDASVVVIRLIPTDIRSLCDSWHVKADLSSIITGRRYKTVLARLLTPQKPDQVAKK